MTTAFKCFFCRQDCVTCDGGCVDCDRSICRVCAEAESKRAASTSDPTRVAVVARWRKHNLPHIMAGYLVESDFACFGSASLTFGDGRSIQITDPADVILTDIVPDRIDE